VARVGQGTEHAPRLERTALVVDDDVFMVSALAELLEEDGYDVQTATNGFSGLRHATELRPSVILLDLALPERSGMDLLADLRAESVTRDLAIVVVTAYPGELTDTLRAAADGLVSKPFDIDELRATIQRAVQRAAARRAEVARVAPVPHREAPLRGRRPAARRRSRR
jgi:DNA-binding response OmpR family regulator